MIVYPLLWISAVHAIHVHMFWTTPFQGRFGDRHRAVLSSYLHHHPSANISVYYQTRDAVMDTLRTSYQHWNVHWKEMDDGWMKEMAGKCPNGQWLLMEDVKQGPFYYSHLTDFLRFCMLLLHGGIYSDFDAILLKPLDLLLRSDSKARLIIGKDELGAGEKTNCEWCLGGGRHYAAPGVMIATESHLDVLRSALVNAFSPDKYNMNVFGWAGPQAITRAVKADRRRQVELLERELFYPVNWQAAHGLFRKGSAEGLMWTRIRQSTHSLHFYGSATKSEEVGDGSIMELLIRTFTSDIIQSLEDVWDLSDRIATIGPLFRVSRGDRVVMTVGSGTLREEIAGVGSIAVLNHCIAAVAYNSTNTIDRLTVKVYENSAMIAAREFLIARLSSLVTIVTKTHGRMSKVIDLVNSIHEIYPVHRFSILAGDDGRGAEREPAGIKRGFEYIPMPFDIGLSEGRNILLKHVNTPFVVLLDDDFVFTTETDLQKLLLVAVNGDFDIVAGKSPRDVSRFQFDYSGLIRENGSILELVKGNNGRLCGCEIVDFVPNVFLARTDALRRVGWDSRLKLGEHEDFFLRAKRMGLKVATCPQVAFEHRQTAFWENKSEYDGMRLRVFGFIADALRKHGFTELVTLGRTVMKLQQVSETPIRTVKVAAVSPYSAQVTAFPDHSYYRYRVKLHSGGMDMTEDYYSTVFKMTDLWSDREYSISVWAGNHTQFAQSPIQFSFRTPGTNDNLLMNPGFDSGILAPEWKGSLGTPYNLIETSLVGGGNGTIVGRSDGYALGISVVSRDPFPEYSRHGQYYHSVHQTVFVEASCQKGGNLILAGWSHPDHFFPPWDDSPVLLGYRLQLEAVVNGMRKITCSDDFDHQSTVWHSHSINLPISPGEVVNSATARIVLDGQRAGAFFDDLYLGLWCI